MHLTSPRGTTPHTFETPSGRSARWQRCAAFAAVAMPFVVHAQTPSPPSGFSATLGLGATSTSTYEGSPNRRMIVGPDLSMSYRSSAHGTFELGAQGLTWTPSGDDEIRFGLVLGADPGRLDRRPGRLNPTPGDSRLAGMGKIDCSVEAGAFVGFGPLMVTARRSLRDSAQSASRVDIGLQHGMALSDQFALRVEAVAAWADRRYLQTQFGVTSAQAAASGYRAYAPEAGWHRYALGVSAEYRLTKEWIARAALTGTRLAEVPAKSPLVAKRTFSTVAASIVREF